MSLRTRWALTLGLVTAVAIGVAVVAALVFTQRQLRSEVDADLRRRVESPMEIADLLRERFRGPDRQFRLDAVVQVITPDGAVLTLDGAPALPVTEADRRYVTDRDRPLLRDVTVEGDPYRMITAHIDTPRADGAVQVAVDVSSIDRSLTALRRRLLLLWLGASAVAGGVGWMIARRAVTPIERLTAAAEHVAATEEFDVSLDTEAPAEIGRLAASFSAMLASLQRSRDQQRQLASDAGHELRTPLTALRTNLETLRRRESELSGEQRRELIDAAITEVAELSTLSSELVDLASDVARTEVATSNVSLDELVNRVVDRYRRRTGRRIEVSGTGVVLDLRELQMERALSNLLENAVKFSPSDQPIEVSLAGSSLSVRDHGPGIPQHDLPHVFDRFYRSVEARTTPGSGLGLAIVKLIVEAHGGSVGAANHPGGGAVLTVALPPSS